MPTRLSTESPLEIRLSNCSGATGIIENVVRFHGVNGRGHDLGVDAHVRAPDADVQDHDHDRGAGRDGHAHATGAHDAAVTAAPVADRAVSRAGVGAAVRAGVTPLHRLVVALTVGLGNVGRRVAEAQVQMGAARAAAIAKLAVTGLTKKTKLQ